MRHFFPLLFKTRPDGHCPQRDKPYDSDMHCCMTMDSRAILGKLLASIYRKMRSGFPAYRAKT
jgi:hypothetical protein